MNSPKTYVLILLALTTIGGAVLSWQQYQELVELRAIAMNKDERANFQKRLWELEKLNKELQDRLAALRGDQPGDMVAGDERPPGERGRGPGGPGGPRGGPRGVNPMQQLDALRGLMSKPEVQALLSVQQKAAIEARYAALFKNLNLSPEQRAKFESTLIDFQATQMDVMTAAREQGIRDPEGIRKLMADARSDFDNSLKSVLGDSGFAQYQNYEQTMPQRNLVNQLQQRLSYTDTPLTSAQADQLVNILAANPAPRPTPPAGAPQRGGPPPGGGDFGGSGGLAFRGGPGPGGPDIGAGLNVVLAGGDLGGVIGAAMGGGPGTGGGRGGNGTAAVTTAAVNQAQTVLSQPQVTALQQIQQQQQTQQQLQQIVRDTLATTQPPPPPARGGSDGGTAPRKRPGGE